MLRNFFTDNFVTRFLGIAAAVGTIPLLAEAAEPKRSQDQKLVSADQLVSEALYGEIYGDAAARQRMLLRAIDAKPDHNAANWQLGKIKLGNEWLTIDEFVEQTKHDRKTRLYQKMKQEQPNNAEEHLATANWCNKRRMHDQERAHLEAVLREEPNHVEARTRLAYRSIGGAWRSPEEISAELERLEVDYANRLKWNPLVREIAIGLQSTNPTEQQKAQLELARIDDPAAILSLELMLSIANEAAARLVVDRVSTIGGQASADSLARHALFSQWPGTRDYAALKLRSFEQLSYVPTLLSSLQTEVKGLMVARPALNGRLFYRHSLFNETESTRRILTNDTEFQRVTTSTDNSLTEIVNRTDSRQRAINEMNRQASQTSMAVSMRNMETRETNERIASALRIATAEKLGDDPRDWWQWWNEKNGIVISQKEVDERETTQVVPVVDRIHLQGPSRSIRVGGTVNGADTKESESEQSKESRSYQQQAIEFSVYGTPMEPDAMRTYMRGVALTNYECFVAGTPVTTNLGLKPIEKLTIGDMVLSKHAQTGELTFKPVIRCTVRPPEDLLSIRTSTATLRCSDGHPFWVSGSGWTMAKDVTPGMSLHTVDGFTTVEAVASGGNEATFNLVVADFHSYFVGNQRVLSHDFTMRKAITNPVPGMVSKE